MYNEGVWVYASWISSGLEGNVNGKSWEIGIEYRAPSRAEDASR